MSKSVLISINPKWCELIASGKKTVEVRKTKPKIDVPFKCYIYQTKAKDKLVEVMKDGDKLYGETYHGEPVFIKTFGKHHWDKGNGKVIGYFVCDRIDEYSYDQAFDESMGVYIDKYGYDITSYELGQTCLTYEDFENYGDTNRLYGWHISNLVIYDKPKELSEFRSPCTQKQCASWCKDMKIKNTICLNKGKRFITRPPQSWQFVEELEV